jgi:hypothetical protein
MVSNKYNLFLAHLAKCNVLQLSFIWPSSFRGEDLKKSANQKQELPVAAMFGNGTGKMCNL